MIKKRPISPKELFIKHVEFAAEFGKIRNFDIAGRKMSFFSYFLLDIIVPFLLIIAGIVITSFYLLKKLFVKFFHKKSKIKKQ